MSIERTIEGVRVVVSRHPLNERWWNVTCRVLTRAVTTCFDHIPTEEELTDAARQFNSKRSE
jgi:hypothetical protein